MKIILIVLSLLVIVMGGVIGVGAYKYHQDTLAWLKKDKQSQDQIKALNSKVAYESKQIKGLQDSISTPAQPSTSICAALGCKGTAIATPTPPPVVSPTHCSSTTYGVENQFTDTNCY